MWMTAGVILASAGAVLAQPDDQPDSEALKLANPAATPEAKPEASPFGFGAIDYTLRAYTSYQTDAGLRSDNGEVAVGRAGLDFKADMPIDAKSILRLKAGAEYSNFDWANVQKLSVNGGDPPEELSSYKLGVGYERQIDETWSFLGRAMLRDGIEGGAKFTDGIAGDITGGVMYQARPGVKIGVGMTAFWRIEDYTRFLPVPFVDLDLALSEHWRIVMTIPEWAGFVYKPSNEFSLDVGVGVRWQDYRLSANNAVPEGVFREFSLPAMVDVNWKFAPAWTLQAGVGTNLYQRFDLNDKDGNDVAHATTDLSPIFLLGVQWNF